MKNWPALAIAAGLVATALTVTPAAAADPAPTNVQISWKDDSFQAVRVRWDEGDGRPNKIVLLHAATAVPVLTVYVPAGATNEVDIASAQMVKDAVLEVAVSAGTGTGETSPAGRSARFDTALAKPPFSGPFSLTGSATVTAEWTPAPTETDSTPNDPLDRTDPAIYRPQYELPDRTTVNLAAPSTATKLTFTGPGPEFLFQVAAQNEWGVGKTGAFVQIFPNRLTAVIPTWVKVNSAQARITGTFAPGNAQIVLQARNTPTSAWYAVASRHFWDNKYSFELGYAGSRQYRVAMTNTVDDFWGSGWFGGYSKVGAMTVQITAHAGFSNFELRPGQTTIAQLSMAPAIVGKAILQRWNGKVWSTVGPVPIANGFGRGYIRGAALGRVAYRYYLPSGWVKGMWYAATYTPTFAITTVR